MDVYLPSDKPECCPACGARAVLDYQNDKFEIYHCPDEFCDYDVWLIVLTEDVPEGE